MKWRHWSYIHCSWDTRETLFQLAGYKRVKKYIKRMEDLDRKRRILSREEIELLDVERQMEYEISLQHQNVRSGFDRVQHLRTPLCLPVPASCVVFRFE